MNLQQQNKLLQQYIESLQGELSVAYETIDALRENIRQLVQSQKEQIMLKSEITRENLSKSQVLEQQDAKLQSLEDQIYDLNQQVQNREGELSEAYQKLLNKVSQMAQLDELNSKLKGEILYLKEEKIELNETSGSLYIRIRILEAEQAEMKQENAQLLQQLNVIKIDQEAETEEPERVDQNLQAVCSTNAQGAQTEELQDLIQTTVGQNQGEMVARLYQEIANLNEQRTRWIVGRYTE